MRTKILAVVFCGLLMVPACSDDDGPSETGTIEIALEEMSGMEGYRVLAVVWAKVPSDLAGGAFWRMIDADPYSADDAVHPPYLGGESDEDGSGEGWGADDYLWDEVANLEPGTYQIDLSANPGELNPYGSHIPAEPIERRCVLDVEVTAGETTRVTITDVPAGTVEQCPT